MNWTNVLTSKFQSKYYSGVITIDNIPDNKEEVTYEVDDFKEKIKGWKIPYGKQKLFLPDEIDGKDVLELLPIKITETEEFTYKNDALLRAKKVLTFRIAPENQMSVRDIVDTLAEIDHSELDEYKLFSLLVVGSYIRKFNWRIASTAGFGKNCLADNLKRLCRDVQCYQPKSAPKLKKECDGRSLVIANEFMELSKQNKLELEDFFRYVGDNNPELENSSLGSSAFGTKEKYTTDNLSVGVIYNLLDYYRPPMISKDRSDEFFDKLYTLATKERYLPLLFDRGEINSGQFKVKDEEEEYQENEPIYLAIVKSLRYHQNNFEESIQGKEKWIWNNERVIGNRQNRLNTHLQSFIEFIRAYSKSEQEFNVLADKVWEHYKAYQSQLVLDPDHPIHKEDKGKTGMTDVTQF